MSDGGLDSTLAKLSRIKDIDELQEPKSSTEDVFDSFSFDDSLFNRAYSSAGSMHTSLSEDGHFHKEGFYGQAKLIQKVIQEMHAQQVLELCSGKGFNLTYLAKRCPEVQFKGVDLMPEFIRASQRDSRSLENLSHLVGNIEELDFPPETFDIVFVVEALFHVTDLTKALAEAYRILKPGGRFITIDYHRVKELEELESTQRKALRAAENAFVILNPMSVIGFVEAASQVGFKLVKVDDLSTQTLPQMQRLSRLIGIVFKFPLIANLIRRFASSFVIEGIVGWDLMPTLIRSNLLGYYQITFERS